MKRFIKFLKNGGAFAIILLITVYLFSFKFDFEKLISIILQCNPLYIAIAVLGVFLFLVCESINIRRGLIMMGDKQRHSRCFKYAVAGFFFSGITPAATGGQPMQALYMHRDGIPFSHGTLALAMELVGYQMAAVVYAVIGLITNYKIVFDRVNNIWFIVIAGLTVNILLLVFVMIAVFSKHIVFICINLIEKILVLFRYKKVEMFRERADRQISEYRKCARLVIKDKYMVAKFVGTSLIEIGALHSVPFWVYKSFGLTGYSFFTIFALQAVLFISVSILPLPGSIGVSEGGFLILFKRIIPSKIIGGAMILSRGISFYIFVVIAGTSLGIYHLFGNKHNKTNEDT